MKHSFLLLVVALSFSVSAHSAAKATPTRIVLPTGVTPTHYDIDVTPDAQKMSFAGMARIAIEVTRPTRTITLNALDLSFGKVALDDRIERPKVTFDDRQQTVTFTFSAPISVGKHLLSLAYDGKINLHASGLFALDYDSAQGKKRSLFTQFENSDARRFVPSWDEPSHKATFTISAVVPADAMAVSNMPVASTDALSAQLKRVHFLPSPKMSSYLLFLGVGDFERLSRTVNGVDIGIIVKRGDTAQAKFALDAASHLLVYYEDYFGVKYPLPKLDLLAAAGTSQFFSAMENWGAIFYFERYLLVDPKISTQADRRDVYSVIAHEMAHQWFGDLVTMEWWDGIWLNEGFASWMASKALDHFHPEWMPWLDSQGSKDGAMRTDARRGTHPIIQPIDDVLQANEAFDVITYSKGEAVIRMLENYVGEEGFRQGVRQYIRAHMYGNTVSDDLWRELDKTSPTRISDIAHDFTRQAGVPLVHVEKTSEGVRLTQNRFTLDEAEKQITRWRIPVVRSTVGSKDLSREVLDSPTPMDIATPADAVVNAGQTGYFRTLYSPALMDPLIARFRELSAADELGLVDDSVALGYAGQEPLSDFLAMTQRAYSKTDPAVLKDIAGCLREMDLLYEGLPAQARFQAFARGVLHPLLADIGWTPRADENQNVTLLRTVLLVALSELDDPQVIAQARQFFADFQRNSSALAPDLRHDVLGIVALHADEVTWESLHGLAKNAASDVEKQEFYGLLGIARDPVLAGRAMQLALLDEAPITTRPDIIANVSELHADMAFEFALAHLEALMTLLEPDSRAQFVPNLVSHSYNADMIPKLHDYANAHIPATARQSAVKAESRITYKVMVRKQRLPDVDRWLETAAAAGH